MICLIIRAYGTKVWLWNGEFHRVNGPAVIENDGSLYWYRYSQMHRTDGPAVIDSDGTIEWYINDNRVSMYEHMFLTNGYDD